MSQPPQNQWGPQGDSSYGQGSANGFGQGSSNNFGQDFNQAPSFGQPSPNGYGQEFSQAPAFGQSGPMAPAEPPKKNGGKIALIVCAGCAVLLLLLGIAGAGLWFFSGKGDDRSSSPTQSEQSEEPSDEPTSEEPTTEEPSEEPTGASDNGGADPATGTGQGTKDAPYALNQPFTLDDGQGGKVEVVIGTPNWNGNDVVAQNNEFNEKAPEGKRYVIIPVKVTYHGSQNFTPSIGLTLNYVSNTGNTFSTTDTIVVMNKGRITVNALHDGGSAEYEDVIAIPVEMNGDSGLFEVSMLLNFTGEPVYISAK